MKNYFYRTKRDKSGQLRITNYELRLLNLEFRRLNLELLGYFRS